MHHKTDCQHLYIAFLLLFTSPAATTHAVTPTSAETAASFEPALRDLWSRGSERFRRQWLVAGPIDTMQAAQMDASALRPEPGQPLSPTLVPTSRWIAQAAWGDILDLNAVAAGASTSGGRSIFVAATLPSKSTHVDLSFGSDGPLTIWLNGHLMYEGAADSVYVPDRERVPIVLNEGDNVLMIRFDQKQPGPWRFALRVLAGAADRLRVKTHIADQVAAAPVDIDVLAAGGRVVAHAGGSRGAMVGFDTAAWLDGAYEVRATTHDAWGQRYVTHLPWYKGDAIAAARRLVADAAVASNDPTSATRRMLADLVQDRVGEQFDRLTPDSWMRLHSTLLEYEELRLDTAKQRGSVHGGGFVRIAYIDDADGSMQFCRAYLPLDYLPERRWPLVLWLHGFYDGNPAYLRWWSVDQRHSSVADSKNVILVEPHGRANAQYRGIGEQDVLRCLDAVKQRLSVDEDRVYLTGGSMGGHGTWWIASRHPELFAAAAPVYGGWDFRVTSISGPRPRRHRAMHSRHFCWSGTVPLPAPKD
jgi:hypothetical protein